MITTGNVLCFCLSKSENNSIPINIIPQKHTIGTTSIAHPDIINLSIIINNILELNTNYII